MTSTSNRNPGMWVIALLVIGIGGAFAWSLLRPAAPNAVPGAVGGAAVPGGSPQLAGNSDAAPAEKIPLPPPPKGDYVGAKVCAECHAKIAEKYASHPMANSTATIQAALSAEDLGDSATFTPDGRHIYAVEKSGDGVIHRERLLDSQGKPIYDQAVNVEYVIGSGAHGKSYVFERHGVLFMSPLSWYRGGQQWNLSPGYELPNHPRFERLITSGCLDCHVGRTNFVRGWENHVGQPPFLELSIGCERCHGPGGEHVAFHRASTGPGKTDPIVNPAKLDAARREDICAQCHMQGEARIPNYGCDFGDFRPGQRLEETLAVFVKGTRTAADGTSLAVSHVEQTRSSVCFQKSNGKFGCTSCHDPHSMPAEAEKHNFYREKCLACHQDHGCQMPEPERRKIHADDSCMRCHMIRSSTRNVPHTSNTDHRVLRRPSAMTEDDLARQSFPEFFDHAEQRLPEWSIDRARGLLLAGRAEMRSDPDFADRAASLLKAVTRRIPDDAEVLHALGTVSAVGGKIDEALPYWKQALALEPNREWTLRSLALAYQNTRRMPESLPYLNRYLEIQPWDGAMWGRYSNALGITGDWKGALDAALKAEAADPSKQRIYQWLAMIHKQLGNEQQSQHYQQLSERMGQAPPGM